MVPSSFIILLLLSFTGQLFDAYFWVAVSSSGLYAASVFNRFFQTPAYISHTVLAAVQPYRLTIFPPNILHRAYAFALPALRTPFANGKRL